MTMEARYKLLLACARCLWRGPGVLANRPVEAGLALCPRCYWPLLAEPEKSLPKQRRSTR